MQGFEVKAERGGVLVTRNSLGMSLLSLCPRQFVVVGEGFFAVEATSRKVRICRRQLEFR